jgi:glutathione S-transferase
MSAEFTIYIGNMNYSSWSLRGWLPLRLTGATFEQVKLPLDTPEFRDSIGDISPSGCVPVLVDHRGEQDIRIWDSLAITDYLARAYPGAGLWPGDSPAWAYARSIVAEMHSGFSALRSALPMNIRADFRGRSFGPAVKKDVARIEAIWNGAQTRFSAGGPYLFGPWLNAADCYYAPVASRIKTYGVTLGEAAQAYVEALLAHPFMQEWTDGARSETAVVAMDEIDPDAPVLG